MTAQPETREPKFKFGDVAIFVHDSGQRMVKVEATTFHGDMQRVHEYYIQPGDTKTRFQLYGDGDGGFPYTSLIKVRDEAQAKEFLDFLEEERVVARRLISDASMEARRIMSRATQTVRELAKDPEPDDD